MTDALERLYASNSDIHIHALEIFHSGITGGVLRIAQSFDDIEATLEDSTTVTFAAACINILPPEKTTDGEQYLNIEIDNSGNDVWPQISSVIDATRSAEEEIICKYRAYVLSDLSEPGSATLRLIIRSGVINRVSASLRAEYTPIPDTVYPRNRYYASKFPGVKHA